MSQEKTDATPLVTDEIGNILPDPSKAIPSVVENISDDISLPPEKGQGDMPADSVQGETDSCGTVFNPAIHFPDRRKTKTGKFRKRKGGTDDDETPKQDIASNPANPETTGKALSVLFFGLGSSVIGSTDFMPENQTEAEMVEKPMAVFCAQKGLSDIPPSIALVLAMVAYTAHKAASKKTVKEKLIEKFVAIKRMLIGGKN